LQTFERFANDVLSVKIADESEPIGVTSEHPFFVKMQGARNSLSSEDGEWRKAGELLVGDEVLKADGTWATVENVETRSNDKVYNFEVSQNHNYFVGEQGLLVHNTCSGKNPPINRGRQDLHTNGTPGKTQFDPKYNADDLTRQAWEMGDVNKTINHAGKRYTFDHPIGTYNGRPAYTVDVRFSSKSGIHGFPTKNP
jgi:hypothetical protein